MQKIILKDIYTFGLEFKLMKCGLFPACPSLLRSLDPLQFNSSKLETLFLYWI